MKGETVSTPLDKDGNTHNDHGTPTRAVGIWSNFFYAYETMNLNIQIIFILKYFRPRENEAYKIILYIPCEYSNC